MSFGDSTSTDPRPSLTGSTRGALQIAADDARRSAELAAQIAAQSCEVCKKSLTDAQVKKGSRRCFAHRLPNPRPR